MTTTENSPKYVVCPECEGEGHFGPGFVWTQDQIDEADPDEFWEMQRMLREGQFDTPCQTCKGQRAVVNIETDDEGGISTAAERWRDECEYRAEVAAEQRYFGYC